MISNYYAKYTAIKELGKSLKSMELPLNSLDEFKSLRGNIYFTFKKPNESGIFAYIKTKDMPDSFTVYRSSEKLRIYDTKKEIIAQFKKDNPTYIILKT